MGRARVNSRPGSFESLESRQLLASDLTASLSLTAGAYKPGNTIAFQFTMRNNGTTPVTTPFGIEFRLTKNLVFGDADDIGRVTIPVRSPIPGNNVPVTIAGTLPIPVVAGAGQYCIGIKMDSANAVSESNESNNVSFTSVGALDILTGAGVLIMPGTSGADTIQVSGTATTISTRIGAAAARTYPRSLVTGVIVQAGAGNDTVSVGNGLSSIAVYGDSGDDTLTDGDGANAIIGGGGRDKLNGGAGNDRLVGGSGNDRIFGEGGRDRLYGDAGNDYLDGGSHDDRLEGGLGTDTYYGQGGNDTIFARDTVAEQIFAVSGTDAAQADPNDVRSGVETLIV